MLQGKHITFSYSDSAKGKIDVLKELKEIGYAIDFNKAF